MKQNYNPHTHVVCLHYLKFITKHLHFGHARIFGANIVIYMLVPFFATGNFLLRGALAMI